MLKTIIHKKVENLNKNIYYKLCISILILSTLIIIPELIIRVTVGRGKRFYILREVTFKLPEVRSFNEKIDILFLGGSASNGMGLKNLNNRYSELLGNCFPNFNIINDSNTGIPLSEINFYLYNSLKIKTPP